MRTHDTTQVRTGIDVYGADGEKIGIRRRRFEQRAT